MVRTKHKQNDSTGNSKKDFIDVKENNVFPLYLVYLAITVCTMQQISAVNRGAIKELRMKQQWLIAAKYRYRRQ